MNLLFTCKKKRVFEENNEFYNRMVIVKKIYLYFLVLAFMMVGCSNDNLQRITDDNTSQAIFNYDFNY